MARGLELPAGAGTTWLYEVRLNMLVVCTAGLAARLQRFGVGFVAVGVFEEHSVAAPNRHFAVALRIPRKTDAGSGIEQVALHAAVGHSRRHAALHNSVERIPNDQPGRGIGAARARNVTSDVEVVFVVIALAVSSEQAHPQPEVQSQMAGNVPVILEVRLEDLVAVVELGLRAGSGEKDDTLPISKSAKALPVLMAELLVSKVNVPFVAVPGARQFVLLRSHEIAAKLQVVFADNLGDVVPVGVGRIGVVWTVGQISDVFAGN